MSYLCNRDQAEPFWATLTSKAGKPRIPGHQFHLLFL